jgi:tetratricopeptide (TPR) repeat protein/serine/threonine protein kinase
MSDTSLSALERMNGICDRFNEAWPARPRPRVADFLSEAPEEDRPELRDALLGEAVFRIQADQRRRWGQGERVPVEDYLREDPALREEPERVLELVDNELALRRERGEAPRAEEYLALLPGHEAELRRRFAGGPEATPPTVDEPRAPDTMRPGTVAETLPATAQPGEPVPPELGHYRPVAFIGRGGVGDVFRYYDPQMDRELAVKVLRQDHRGNPSLVRRFQKEARLNSRLQHPNVVPVHAMERAADGRPYFTMKLVRGRTLAELLAERASPAQDLPRFLAVFEQVCQALAYAHSQGVIHRDLKPHNVMVGAFAEVQVMDWGLAKVLGPAEEGAAAPAAPEAWAGLPAGVEGEAQPTRAGQVMGTLAYMPPEQARGEVERVDRRSDVFGLGAILCEVLTGKPPFAGQDESERWARARACDHAEALARLDGCGADAEMVGLCKDCLAPAPEDRPSDAGKVALAVAAYQAEVQKRLQAAERERAAAQARAEEARKTAAAERQARRRTLALAGAVLLLVVGGGSAGWWFQQKRQAADTASAGAMAEARLVLAQAKSAPLADAGKYHEALELARKAEWLASTGGASAAVRQQATDLVAELEREVEAADRDRRLLVRLPDVRGPREGPKYRKDDKGYMVALAEPTADEQFAGAFREWGLDVDAAPTAEAAARLTGCPPAVVMEVIAALDEWASERRRQGRPEADWRRLADLAAALDDDPDPRRRELRAILARGRLPVERALGVLSAALRPVPVPVEVPLGADRGRLRQLAGRMEPGSEPVLGLLTLARALRVAGEESLAEELLRAAIAARPGEVVLHHALGQLLQEQGPPRWAEAVVCYTAARALRPRLGVSLARALIGSGDDRQGLALLDRLVKEAPDNPYLHFQQGNALHDKGDLEGAVACHREVLALDPKYALAHYNLGVALHAKGDAEGAVACWYKALALNPKYAPAHSNLGAALYEKGDVEGAIACCHKAIDLDPKLAPAHYNLGVALYAKGDVEGAIAYSRRAIALDPRDAPAHGNLGNALHAKGDLEGAIACLRQAIDLDPKLAPAYNNLGSALREKGDLEGAIACHRIALALEPKNDLALVNLGNALQAKGDLEGALACFREALALDPKYALAHYNLGNVLRAKGDVEGAVACWHKAIDLNPKYAPAHVNLGNALQAKGDLEGAIACWHKAITLDPKLAQAHNSLGNALRDKGDLEGAVSSYRRTLALDPKDAPAHYNLGNALRDKGDLEGAIACFREAIACWHKALDPKLLALAHYNLGSALLAKGKINEAIAEIRKAIEIDPKDALAHYNLGNALRDKGDLEGAVACFRRAIALDPNYAEAHCNLGLVLRRQGQLAETLACLKRGHELGSKRPDWRYPSAQWVRQAERLVALDRKLAAVLKDPGQPADAAERLAFAQLCQQYKKLPRAAARFYADAFAAEPKLAADLRAGHRYNAACAAALAAAGQGEDAMKLADEERTRLRQQALDWLRVDLAAWTQVLDKGPPQARQVLAQTLQHWQKDADFAALREKAALDKLPAAERDSWQRLWADVAALLQRAQEK